MRDYRRDILEHLILELKELEWVELPDNTRELIGEDALLNASVEYPSYLQVSLDKDNELVLGFGDAIPDMWDGVLHWQLKHYWGEIVNGSPRFVLWTLFEQLEEQLKEEGN